MDLLRPKDIADLVDLVGAAADQQVRLDVRGHGNKAGIGAPRKECATVDVSAIAGIVDYDPAELVLTVRPGTKLTEVEELLTSRGQMLAFEPFDPLRRSDHGVTIGGMVAAGFAGSRRLTRGAIRDHLLGFSAVSGRGEAFVSGGKVVKNVTGYDLSKLMCGSWGRLAIFTELTLKVLPAPQMQQTLAVFGLNPEAAREAMSQALASRAEVAAAAYLPAIGSSASCMLLRLEGIAPSIAARIPILARALEGHALVDVGEGKGEWQVVSRLLPFGGAAQMWRIVLPARAMPALGAILEAAGAKWLADWAGGLVWTDWAGDAEILREHVGACGGHAMLVHADAETRSHVPALHPQAAGLCRLEARVRRAFDPVGVFETGRFGGSNAD